MFIDKKKYKEWLLPNNFNVLSNTDKKKQEKIDQLKNTISENK